MHVASVPAAHPYVRALAHPDVVRLPDPPVPGAAPGCWWPSPWLEPDHVRARADEFDVMHVHFGFDDRGPSDLARWVAVLRALGRPLVLTVHDLRNPHHEHRGAHDRALDVLVPAAAALITLTRGAADEIARRWGRTAQVLPHPVVVPATWARRPRPVRDDDLVVGLHAKSHRTNADPVRVARALLDVAATLPGTTVRVDAHDDERGRAVARALSRAAGPEDPLDLRVHAPFDDDEFCAYLQELDVSVLPYRWGTHSGWAEACHDLGTTVLVPDVGHLAEQVPCLVYRLDADGPDGASLARALHVVHRERPRWRADPEARERERAGVAAAHAALYRELHELTRTGR